MKPACFRLVCALFPCLIGTAFFGCGKAAKTPAATPDSAVVIAVVTPEPTPSPTPAPVCGFLENPDAPFPAPGGSVPFGKGYKLSGTVTATAPLLSVTVWINCDFTEDERYPYERTVTFDPAANITSYSLDSPDTLEGVSLDSLVKFSELHAGHHRIVVSALAQGAGLQANVLDRSFDVLRDEWNRIDKDDFSNGTYATALAFFGDRERFLYRYQWVYERYTIAEKAWEEAYLVELAVDAGEPWRMHVDAVPYYEAVRNYLHSAYFRVHGTNGDTGVLPLTRCIESYSGTYCSRFTSSKKRISHHAFGTASDLNATLAPNENTKDNLALLDHEVRDCLAYNGILTDESGRRYYDFTYTGGYQTTAAQVPETVLNYLLYELAFYRAGFQWGHYYNSTSDGMHFTLTDNLMGRHDSAERGLRKVYDYYD